MTVNEISLKKNRVYIQTKGMPESQIKNILYIFRFIKDTGIIPNTLLTHINGQTTQRIFQKNRTIVLVILMINMAHKIMQKIYRMQELQLMNGKFRHMPKHMWKNDYPIILVHGYFGYVPDSCHLFEKKNYF